MKVVILIFLLKQFYTSVDWTVWPCWRWYCCAYTERCFSYLVYLGINGADKKMETLFSVTCFKNHKLHTIFWRNVLQCTVGFPDLLFPCWFEATLRKFWGNAFLCFIGNRCRGEHFFSLSWTFWSVYKQCGVDCRAAVLPIEAEIDFMRELMSGLWLERQGACVCFIVADG